MTPPRGGNSTTNVLTVDVEEHFQVSAFEGVIPRAHWESMPSRVRRNMEILLDLLDEASTRATFFVLGWIARRHPDLVRTIVALGHEIASHGYSHRLIYHQNPTEFRREAEESRRILQDLSGQPVLGYRAASFSVCARSLWALDALSEAGYRYDSSVFPVVHDRYGLPGARREIHEIRGPAGGKLIELPPSTVRLGRLVLPVAGGGYLRILPEGVTRWAVRRLNEREGRPAVVYLHPWELDPEQPRIPGPLRSRLRHYTGLRTTRRKLRNLLARFSFAPAHEVLAAAGFPLVDPAPVGTSPGMREA